MSKAGTVERVDYFNNIILAGEPGGIFTHDNADACRSFGFGDAGISFVENGLATFEENVRKLHQLDKSIHNTISLKRFEEEVVKFVHDKVRTRTVLQKGEEREFFQNLRAIPIRKYFVLREVLGLILSNLTQPFVLGPFTIYHFPSHKNVVNSRTDAAPDVLWNGREPEYLIEVATDARHPEKATDQADILFEKFELALRFAIGFSHKKFEVGVLNYRGRRGRRSYVFCEDRTYSSLQNYVGAREQIPIDDPFFTEAEIGFDRIWNWIGATSMSELSKRLLLAIEWAGQSYNELSPASAFLKSAISLEIVFTHNEKALINASILSQMAESIALILGNSAEERMHIEGVVKDLYSKRSSIAHAGKAEVAEEDLYLIFDLARQVIVKMMTSEALRGLSSIVEVHKYLKAKKYSCPRI